MVESAAFGENAGFGASVGEFDPFGGSGGSFLRMPGSVYVVRRYTSRVAAKTTLPRSYYKAIGREGSINASTTSTNT